MLSAAAAHQIGKDIRQRADHASHAQEPGPIFHITVGRQAPVQANGEKHADTGHIGLGRLPDAAHQVCKPSQSSKKHTEHHRPTLGQGNPGQDQRIGKAGSFIEAALDLVGLQDLPHGSQAQAHGGDLGHKGQVEQAQQHQADDSQGDSR